MINRESNDNKAELDCRYSCQYYDWSVGTCEGECNEDEEADYVSISENYHDDDYLNSTENYFEGDFT